jgi:probable F420-dependent oxidoreductase
LKVGVVFPQNETSPGAAEIREYATAVEAAGFDHLIAYDHVLGASPDRPGGWSGPYTDKDVFHEVFVLFGYLAAITERLELATGVLILPQRQTALVARQAAEVDLLSNQRFRLGVGLGWNAVEYEALGEDFHNRGRRIEEQVELMRALWKEPIVDFKGQFHRVTLAGLNPMPRRVIPVWMGGTNPKAKERIARIADGWMQNTPIEADRFTAVAEMRDMVRAAGRDVDEFGIEVRVAAARDLGKALEDYHRWQELGVSHLTIHTLRSGLSWPGGHLDAVLKFKAALPAS